MCASIQDPSIGIEAYDTKLRDVCDYDFFFTPGFYGIKGAVKFHSMWQIRWIHEDFIPPKVIATSNIRNYTPLHSKSQIELTIWFLPSAVHIRYWQTDFHWRQTLWLQQVGRLANNSAQMTMWEHQIRMLEIHRVKAPNSGNPWINFIHHLGIVTCLASHHFQVLESSTTRLHRTWLPADNQTLVQPINIWVMDVCVRHIISPNEDMMDLK